MKTLENDRLPIPAPHRIATRRQERWPAGVAELVRHGRSEPLNYAVLLHLQQVAGNAAVTAALAASAGEASTAAAPVRVSRKCADCDEEADSALVQRKPKAPMPKARKPKAKEKAKAAPAEAKGPSQQVFVVRYKGLFLGGTMVRDLTDFKDKVMSTKVPADWTLVLSMHGSEDRLGAQSPPDWKKAAIFYEASDIEALFNGDKDFVKWRDQFGPTFLSLVSCQVSASFEGTLISNLTRPSPGGNKRQEQRGLGTGCKPIATAIKLDDAPETRAKFDKLSLDRQKSIREQLSALNQEWGYYGAPPVREDQLVHFYYDEDPKGEWVEVEVRVGSGHDVDKLKKTGIPYWNRTTGPKAAEFRRLCDQGIGRLKREHTPAVPDVNE